MLNILKKARKVLLTAASIAVAVLLVVGGWAIHERNQAVTAGWGDSDKGRPSYTIEEINSGVLEDTIVFNSISNSTIGNEKNFVGAREYQGPNTEGIENIWQANEIKVVDGQEYIIRAYVHNNNPWDYNVATNTRIAFNIPTDSATSIPVHGFISSDNAEPSEYWDGVLFTSNSSFHLEYIYGSALLENNGVGAGGLQLSDDIVTKASSGGVLIGYYDYRTNLEDPVILDGVIPGCYQYASYVTIRVKAVFDTDFRISQHIRLKGDTEWHNYVEAEIGDEVEIQFQYQNIDRRDNTHENVMVRSVLPEDLEYVPGSTILYNATWPDGVAIDQDDVTTTGINIGSYEIGANAYIRFTAKVTDTNLKVGSNTLVNWTRGTVNEIVLQDYASVIVNKTE